QEQHVLGEPEAVVHDLDGALELGAADDARDADRRRGDDLDVNARVRERLEHVGGDARVAAHARADERDLPDVRVADVALGIDVLRDHAEHRLGGGEVGFGQGERDVRVPGGGDVLDDHVDVDARVGER